MKRLLICLSVLSLLNTGCNSGGNNVTPDEVLTNFFTALSKKNIEEAKKFVTSDSEGMITMMQMSLKNMDAPEGGDQFNPDKLTIGSPAFSGDEAQVPVTEKASGETVNFFLKKENNTWKVAFDIATLARMARQKMEEPDGRTLEDSLDFDQIKKESEEFQKHLQGVTDSLKQGLKNELDKKKN